MKTETTTAGTTNDLVSFHIQVNGQAIRTSYQVLSMLVENFLNKDPSAEIQLIDGDPAADGSGISNSSTFDAGNLIVIEAGYDGINELIFSGIILKCGIKLSSEHGVRLILECGNEAIHMAEGRENLICQNTPDSELVSEREKIALPVPDLLAEPVLEVEYGTSLLSFDAFVDAGRVKSQMSGITGTVTVKGNASLKPGLLLGLAGLGDRFNGKAFISSVRHIFKEGEWITEAGVGFPGKGFTETQNGLVNASIVTSKQLKITFDEENMVTSILTPRNNSIVLSEKDESITITDQNNNMIILSTSGIEIKSCKDVMISAPGDITLKADGNIFSTATESITSKAVQINVLATAEVKVEAVIAEISASGTMTVKGAMVMIN